MRRLLPLLAAALVLAACSGGDGPAATPTTTTTAAPLPPALARFLDGVADPGTVPFRATYHVVRKLGQVANVVDVSADPPSWQLTVGDLVVVGGPAPKTCARATTRCELGVQEARLSETGIFSRFFSTAPARALANDARRPGAGRPVFSERTVAGVALRCAGIPVGGSVAGTYCLTPEGIFGWVDTPAVHYELTSYAPGAPS